MIITLIVATVFIIGIVCLVIHDVKLRCPDCVFVIGFAFTILGLIASLIVGASIISTSVCKDIEYQDVLYEKEMLEYRIDNIDGNIVGNEMLYNDIVEFNNDLRRVKKLANSPWTSWFNNQDVATIDYIEFGNTQK